MRKRFYTILSGNVLGSAVSFAALPLLSRLYSPEQAGALAQVMAAASIAGAVVHGRLHHAIGEERGGNMGHPAVLAALLSLTLSLPLSAAVIFASGVFDSKGSPAWQMAACAGFICMGTALGDVFAYARAAVGRTLESAILTVLRPIITTLAQISLAGSGELGMVYGAAIGAILPIAYQSAKYLHNESLREIVLRTIKHSADLLRTHSAHIRWSVPQGLLASASWNFLPLLLAWTGSPSHAGYYYVGYRLFVTPLSLFSGAFRQGMHTRDKGTGNEVFLQARTATLRLSLLAGLVAILALTIGDTIVPAALGTSWADATSTLCIFAIGVTADYAKSPLFAYLQTKGAMKLLFRWEASVFLARALTAVPLTLIFGPSSGIAAFFAIGLIAWGYFCATHLKQQVQ